MSEEITEIKLRIDPDNVTLNDLCMLEDQEATALQVRDFLARCVVGENDEPIGKDKALEIVGAMSLTKLKVLTQSLSEQLKDLSEVPPTKGNK